MHGASLERREQVEPTGAHQQDVARAELDAGRGATSLEVFGGDDGAGLQPVDALVAGDVEHDGPPATRRSSRCRSAAHRCGT